MPHVKTFMVSLLVTYSCGFVDMTQVTQSNVSNYRTEDNDVLNLFQQDELQGDAQQTDAEALKYSKRIIEDIKERILKKLNRKEPPKTHVPLSPLQTLNFRNVSQVTIDVAANSTTSKRRESELVRAVVENYTDFDGSDNATVRFHFDLPQQVVNKEFESAELWLFKKENVTEFAISRLIASEDYENETETLTATVRNQTTAENWIRFNVYPMLSAENVTSLDLQISAEEGEWSLDFEENKTPFLIVRSEYRAISKRSLECPADNSSCCRDKFTINFADAGWGDWIVQPESYDAKICRGICTTHYGLPWKHHGRIMLLMCQKNPSMAAALKLFGKQGGCVSCQPIEYQPTSFIYLSEDGTQVLQYMDGMVISKCGCL